MYTFERAALGRPPLARIWERPEEDLEALGRLRVTNGRVQSRESWVSQDVDRWSQSSIARSYAACAAILSAWAFIPSCRTKEDASAQLGV